MLLNCEEKINGTEITPNYNFVFEFEKNFDPIKAIGWTIENWNFPYYCCALYLIIIFSLQRFMKNREKLECRRILIFWNSFLAVFSTFGAVRMLPEYVYVLKNFGLYYSVCVQSFAVCDKVSGFWAWLFVVSKPLELIDKIFLILRKKPLIFLHWYHHAITVICSWSTYQTPIATGRWFITMNYSIMYSYYALKILEFNLPKFISLIVTSLQLIQMIVAVLISYISYHYWSLGEFCHLTKFDFYVQSAGYFSFVILFFELFYNSYLYSKITNADKKKI